MTERTKATATPAHVIDCACEQGEAHYNQFETRAVGCDETDGRYADVTLMRCRACGRLWLHYLVECEGFSRSGRWARGLIGADAVATITPEAAAHYLGGLDWYLYGGSYFDGVSGRRSGSMHWG